MMKVVNWLENTELVNKTSKIIDVGCGNVMTLVELVCATFHHSGFVSPNQMFLTLSLSVISILF